ncbi:hypothetical protein FGO68_gene11178 [Halteria grandinella]|uniref:Uncharacterized protein n=1 Tax=Halteria grandinella TaxID=5974 RepID=A0A8J8NU44_HALGN|nr:hypothetical protein FGO68_gene11178 [Halteria grandinella]
MADFDTLPLSRYEIEATFRQICFENLQTLAFNEESIALKQAAILEVIRAVEVTQSKVVDGKCLNLRIDLRELHLIYPSHLITFFNKKSLWNRIQDQKSDIPLNTTLTQLMRLYVILCFHQQPQVCSQYFPIRVVEYSKQLKPLMSVTLTKKHQPLLMIGPMGMGIANDHGHPEVKCSKHKKQAMIIGYQQIKDLHSMISNPGALGMGSITYRDEAAAKRQIQILYTDSKIVQGEETSLRIVVESDKCQEIIRLIKDYMKEPQEVGWDSQNRRPKDLDQLLISISQNPLQIADSPFKRDRTLPDEYQIYLSIYDRLDHIFNNPVSLKQVLTLNKQGYYNLANYAYYNVLQDPYERHQLTIIANCAKYCSILALRKYIRKQVVKMQAAARGYLVRERLKKGEKWLMVQYAARMIQKVYRGYLVRKGIIEYYLSLQIQK